MSSKKSPTIDTEEWILAVFKPMERPPGSFTIEEVVKKTGIQRRTVLNILSHRVGKGELQVQKFRSENGIIKNAYIPIKITTTDVPKNLSAKTKTKRKK